MPASFIFFDNIVTVGDCESQASNGWAGVPRGQEKMVRPAGFEPAACGLGNRRSVLLSYGRTLKAMLEADIIHARRHNGICAPLLLLAFIIDK